MPRRVPARANQSQAGLIRAGQRCSPPPRRSRSARAPPVRPRPVCFRPRAGQCPKGTPQAAESAGRRHHRQCGCARGSPRSRGRAVQKPHVAERGRCLRGIAEPPRCCSRGSSGQSRRQSRCRVRWWSAVARGCQRCAVRRGSRRCEGRKQSRS